MLDQLTQNMLVPTVTVSADRSTIISVIEGVLTQTTVLDGRGGYTTTIEMHQGAEEFGTTIDQVIGVLEAVGIEVTQLPE